jgi:CTD kinase subunit alpha
MINILNIHSKGAFGTVYKATYMNKYVGVKKTLNDESGEDELRINFDIYNEIKKIQNKEYRDNICSLINYYYNDGHVFLIFPFIEYNLYDILINNLYNFTHKNIYVITLEILNGLEFLHNNNMIHTDLKPHNILMSPENTKKSKPIIKICDFGSVLPNNTHYSYIVTTAPYRSPESIISYSKNKYTYIDESIDMWSLGCIIYFMIYKCNLIDCSYDTDDETVLSNMREYISDYTKQNKGINYYIMNNLLKYKPDRFSLNDCKSIMTKLIFAKEDDELLYLDEYIM